MTNLPLENSHFSVERRRRRLLVVTRTKRLLFHSVQTARQRFEDFPYCVARPSVNWAIFIWPCNNSSIARAYSLWRSTSSSRTFARALIASACPATRSMISNWCCCPRPIWCAIWLNASDNSLESLSHNVFNARAIFASAILCSSSVMASSLELGASLCRLLHPRTAGKSACAPHSAQEPS